LTPPAAFMLDPLLNLLLSRPGRHRAAPDLAVQFP
jgi:hypothetical protein